MVLRILLFAIIEYARVRLLLLGKTPHWVWHVRGGYRAFCVLRSRCSGTTLAPAPGMILVGFAAARLQRERALCFRYRLAVGFRAARRIVDARLARS